MSTPTGKDGEQDVRAQNGISFVLLCAVSPSNENSGAGGQRGGVCDFTLGLGILVDILLLCITTDPFTNHAYSHFFGVHIPFYVIIIVDKMAQLPPTTLIKPHKNHLRTPQTPRTHFPNWICSLSFSILGLCSYMSLFSDDISSYYHWLLTNNLCIP